MEEKNLSEATSEVALPKEGESNPNKGKEKRHDKSKDIVSSMEAQMTHMEEAIVEVQD